MKHIFCICIFCFCSFNLFAQKETIDLITFKAPDGWKKELKDGVISYFTVDKASGSWCRLNVYKSVPSKGSIEADLEKEWSELVAKPNDIKDSMQATATEEVNGWKIKAASGKFVFNKKPAAALLTTFSGYDRCASIVALTNGQRYLDTIQNFISTIDLKKPDTNDVTQTNNTTPSMGSFSFSTTNFDDGWVSKIFDDYVEVTKGSIKVLLSYREKFNESEYSGTGKEKRYTYWNNFVGKYYTLGEAIIRQHTTFSDYSANYIEGWVTDKQTGEKRFAAMMLNIFAYTGTLSVIVATAPDEQQLKQQFLKPDYEYNNDLLPMYGYNKFAVGPNDLTGTWSTNGGGTIGWYSSTTGQYVGATGAATADVFKFENNGTYSSEHKGGYGVVGAMNTYQQKYKGTYTVTNWSVTIDHRWDDKTQTFDAWFEIVKGGRILHLTEGPIAYKLMKE